TTSVSATGTYPLAPGTYQISATVSDGTLSSTATSTFTVVQAGPPPTVTIQGPANGANFTVGQVGGTANIPVQIQAQAPAPPPAPPPPPGSPPTPPTPPA